MTIPSYFVRATVLGMFCRAREDFGLEPPDLLVLLCLATALDGERVTIDGVRLLTGATRDEVLASIKQLKTQGFLEQLGTLYPLTKRGKEAVRDIEKD